MPKKPKNLKPRVFFNASVLLAGLYSPGGASAHLLNLAQKGKIKGIINELVWDEVWRHRQKLGLKKKQIKALLRFFLIVPAPAKLTKKYSALVVDPGDIHLLVSSEALRVDFLVSLDKKHILSLSKQISTFQILSPGELVAKLKFKS